MKIYEKVSPALIGAEEEQLTLHLSEPYFTRWQRLKRKFKLFGLAIKDAFIG